MSAPTLVPRSSKHQSIELEPELEVAVGRVTQQRPSAGFRRVLNVAEGSQLLSRSQCRIWLEDGRVVIRDTSTNGTFVDGQRLAKNEDTVLAPGSVVCFSFPNAAKAELKVDAPVWTLHAPAVAAPAAAAPAAAPAAAAPAAAPASIAEKALAVTQSQPAGPPSGQPPPSPAPSPPPEDAPSRPSSVFRLVRGSEASESGTVEGDLREDSTRAAKFYRGVPGLDGAYLHCSSSDQVAGTVERYFVGVADLLLCRFSVAQLVAAGADVRWEEAAPPDGSEPRAGDFPHVYGAPSGLPYAALEGWAAIPLGADGKHAMPEELLRM